MFLREEKEKEKKTYLVLSLVLLVVLLLLLSLTLGLLHSLDIALLASSSRSSGFRLRSRLRLGNAATGYFGRRRVARLGRVCFCFCGFGGGGCAGAAVGGFAVVGDDAGFGVSCISVLGGMMMLVVVGGCTSSGAGCCCHFCFGVGWLEWWDVCVCIGLVCGS